ncbi:MAG: protease pro-enzyme activation domain-containing protein [Verrucomicrobiia bacterium]
MKMDFQRLFPGALLFASCASSLLLFATTARAADRQVLHGHVPTVVSILNLQPVGRLSATNRLHLAIGLPLRNQDALGALLKQIYDPASPQYHQYLTPEQFTEKFGPTEADYETVMEFAKANHLTVTATFPNRVLVDVEGTAADVEKALHVTMRVYETRRKRARSMRQIRNHP